MKWIRFAVFILVATVLQASLVDIVGISGANIKPDLLLILLVFFAVYCNTTDAVITSFAIGFAADLISSAMGPRIISFGLFGTALAYLHRVVAIRKLPYQSAAIFIICFLAGVLAELLTLLRGQPTVPHAYAVLLGTCLYSSLVGPVLFLPSAWLMRIKTDRFSRN